MVLLSAAIVFAGLGWLGLSDSDDSAPAAVATSSPATAPAPTSAPAAAGGADAEPQDSDQDSAAAPTSAPAPSANAGAGAAQNVPVRIYNNSTVEGLASTTADDLRAAGWNVTDVSNYGEGQIPTSTVYYGTGRGEKEAAEKVAREMGISAEPRFEGIVDAPPGVIVILTGTS